MVVNCPLAITFKAKPFFRPHKTKKKEWLVQPVFCIVDIGSCVPLICPHKKILVDHLEIWDLQLTHWCCPGWPEGGDWLIPPVLLLLLRSWGQLVPATYIALSLHVELVSTWPIVVTVFSQETSVTQSGAPVCTAAWTKIILHSAQTIWYSSDWIDLTKLVTGFPSNPCQPKDLFLFYSLAIVGCLHNISALLK